MEEITLSDGCVVFVEGNWIGSVRPSFDSWGRQEEPDEPAYFEVEAVYDEDGDEIEITEKDAEEIDKHFADKEFEPAEPDYDY